jgi:phenylacetate-CoA ligase
MNSAVLFPPRPRSARVNLAALKRKTADEWENAGRKMCLRLFRETAATVPAYREFLSANGVDPARIKNFRQFSELPTVTRSNYLRAYPYPDLFPDGCINSATTISATSGSTGEPFFFPRDDRHDSQ